MSEKRKVIKRVNLPTNVPIWTGAVLWLLLDRLQPPGWVWGAVGVCYAILFIASIALLVSEQDIDIFKKS